MPKPLYTGDHERVRAALVAAFQPGQACAIGGEPLFCATRLLDLAHKTDELGRRTGGWLGLSCRAHNRGDNAWNWRGRQAVADGKRDPQAQLERDDRAARRQRRSIRAEWDRVQRQIADGEI